MAGPYRSSDDPAGPSTNADAITTWESSRACPDCSHDAPAPVRLFAACKQGVILEACGRCGGVWIERPQATILFGEGTGAGVAAELASLADRREALRAANVARRCVECDAPLARRAFYGIAIDACAAHGIWFDRGEVRAIVAKMNAATFDAYAAPLYDGGTEQIEARGRLNGLLRSLAKEFIAG